MSRYRDNANNKENNKEPPPPPYTNSSKNSCRKNSQRESSKVAIARIEKGTKSEATVQIKDIRQQEREEALVTPSRGETRKEAEVVIEEAAYVVGRPQKTLKQLEIPGNPVVEPSLSGENSPPPYRLLGDMAEEEGNIANEIDTFGFPILDIAKDISMKKIPLSSLSHFQGMSKKDHGSFLF
jgi:hypothetical protein